MISMHGETLTENMIYSLPWPIKKNYISYSIFFNHKRLLMIEVVENRKYNQDC